jgi:sporulation protein YlmC with PRC-barrel domain
VDLVRDVLDNLVLSLDRTPLGRVDGVLAEMRDGAPPRLVAIEMGPTVLARRAHPRLERMLRALARRWRGRAPRAFRIPWERIQKIGLDVIVEVDPASTPGMRTETWLRSRILGDRGGA